VLTFDPERLDLRPGMRALDMGCGDGRHTAELVARGVDVVALDHDPACVTTTLEKVEEVRGWFEAPGEATVLRGDAYALPFDDDAFDLVVAAEVLEHLHDDEAAMAELLRVLRPDGTLVVTVPRFGPEVVCWSLSRAYHEVEGGHVRIYRRSQLRERLARAGARIVDRHHAHALHAPYWWLKCAVGVERDDALLPRLYHRMLVWDMLQRPWVTRTAERLLDPVVGKSVVLYLRPTGGQRHTAPTGEVARAS
jgi:SAM-dependent methyltransferase